MNNFNTKIQLDLYKQQVTAHFNQRTQYDEEGDFHPRLAQYQVEHVGIQTGQKILDIATGTGLVAIAAAELVGSQGYVVGVDISPVMLSQARRKIEAAGLKNIELIETDAEIVDFLENYFDTLFCCSALVFLKDIPNALRRWHRFLKPGGIVSFSGFSETSFPTGIVIGKVAQKYGISLPKWNEVTGTAEKCYNLLSNAGFADIDIKTEQLGDYITIEAVQKVWDTSLRHPLCTQLLQLNLEQLEQAKAEYMAEIEALATERGIWNEITTFFVKGRK